MDAAEFRKIALSLAGASENSHMGHPDFRAGNKIFATLGYPDRAFAMVQLTPEQQREFVAAHPGVFAPAKGAWGRKGSTEVRLADADAESAGAALTAAWRNAQAGGRAAEAEWLRGGCSSGSRTGWRRARGRPGACPTSPTGPFGRLSKSRLTRHTEKMISRRAILALRLARPRQAGGLPH